MEYYRFSENYNVNKLVPITTSPFSLVKNPNKPHFISMMKYNEEQYQKWLKTNTLSGEKGSLTNRIWADFDGGGKEKPDTTIEESFKDANTFYKRLLDLGITEESVQISFSGNKGVGFIVETDSSFSNTEIRNLCFNLASDLKTFDEKMYDNQRIFRLLFTQNEKTGLYKIPLTAEELERADIKEIKATASSLENFDKEEVLGYYKPFKVTTKVKELVKKLETPKKELKEVKSMETIELSFTNKPKFLSNCRWALQNGYFKEGNRSTAFLCLASTYKNLGYDLEHVYRMLKGTAELQARHNDSDRFPDEELYNNIVTQVFSPNWNGGQYSCRQEGSWLRSYCDALGENSCSHSKQVFESPHTLIEVVPSFKEYVKNIDKNTILTGIPSIDKNVFISTGANVGIIGAAGGGKSAIALNILNNTSKAGVKSVFASLDMHRNRMLEKVMYKLSGMKRQDLYKIFQDNKEAELVEKLKEEFGNVFFFNKSSPTVSDVRDYILDCQEKSGEKIKLVMLDYFERVSSDFSDDTQASKRVAGELQDLVNDLDIALITLVQPNKNTLSGGADVPIYDYTKIKGSSFVYQAFRIIMSLWRPFYNPKDFSNDKYMQMAVLKNDLGELSEFAFNWEGKTGNITEMDDYQYDELQRLLKEKEEKNNKSDDGWG